MNCRYMMTSVLALGAVSVGVASSSAQVKSLSSYVFNSEDVTPKLEFVDRLHGVALGRFEKREKVSLPLSKNTSPDYTTTFLDTFRVIDSTGEHKKGGILKVLTVLRFVPPNVWTPSKDQVYMIGYRLPVGKSHYLYDPSGSGQPDITAIGDETWVTGLSLSKARRLVKYSNAKNVAPRDQGPYALATLLLTLAESIGEAKTPEEVYAYATVIAAMSPREWAGVAVGDGSVVSFCPKFDALATKGISSKDMVLQYHIIGTCSALPGSILRHKYFELKVALDKRGKWPKPRLGQYRPDVTPDELIAAAIASRQLQRTFFNSTSTPPKAQYLPGIVKWLDWVDSEFAMEIFDRLARWSDRPDLKAKVAPKYVNGKPVILNREELIRIWKENPPPIPPRRSGG